MAQTSYKDVRLYSWNSKSEGAKQLALALGIKRLKEEGSTFKGREGKTVINWGRSTFDNPEAQKCRIVNSPEAVARASDKLLFYKTLEGKLNPDVLVPWSTDLERALEWVREGELVFARTKLKGSGGEGIVIMQKDDPDSFVKAPLYTKYVKKSDEYRIHVAGGEVFLKQRKGLRKTDDEGNPIDPAKADWKIRNLANGFIFARDNVDPPASVCAAAVAVHAHLGLDFYAADVIYNAKSDRAYVLEVNTAPGLNGSTVSDYAEAIKTLL